MVSQVRITRDSLKSVSGAGMRGTRHTDAASRVVTAVSSPHADLIDDDLSEQVRPSGSVINVTMERRPESRLSEPH